MADSRDLPVEALLQQATKDEQLAFLRATRLNTEEGLGALLDEAAVLVFHDPGRGRRLAEICSAALRGATADRLIPRSEYVQAQAAAIDGKPEDALRLLESARRGWVAQGAEVEALRTELGLMNVLNEFGRHDDAVEAGRYLLAELDRRDASGPEAQDLVELRAGAHQNLGGTYGFMGRHHDALAAYERAKPLFEAIGMTEAIAHLQENSGIELVHLGRLNEAAAEFERAIATYRAKGQALGHACSLVELGRARLLRGDYVGALAAFDEAEALLEPLGVQADQDWLLVAKGDAYLALNLFDEALATYREAERSFRASDMNVYLPSALSGAASALIGAARFAEADDAIAEAAALWEAAGNVPMVATALMERGALAQARGDRDTAVALTERALGAVSGGEWAVQTAWAHLRLADLLLPDIRGAEEHLTRAREVARDLPLPQIHYRLDQRLGALRLRQGHDDEAQQLLERAVSTIEALRSALPSEAMRSSFLRDKTDAYRDLVRLWLDRGDPESLRRAFEVAERAKSRALVDLMLGMVGVRVAALADDLVVERLRALQADLGAVYNALLSGDGARGPRLVALRGRAADLEREIGLLQLRLPVEPAAGDPFGGALSLAALRSRLPDDLVVLAYHVLGDEVVAFVSGADGLEVVRDVASAAQVHDLVVRLTAQWQRFRVGAEFAERHAGRLLDSARRVLCDLHTALVAPVAVALDALHGGGGAVGRLAVVPHGILHQVPFQALFDGQAYLIERWEISYAPSATVLALARTSAVGRDALVMGVTDPEIPEVAAEVMTVAGELPGAHVRLDAEATLATLRADARGRAVLHLACHGLFRRDNPAFSALRLSDGWFSALDALQLDLPGALVVLSACESGASRVIGGGDEVIGLPRAFLGAGAAAVLVSLWLAQDDTTAELMRCWYRRMGRGQRRTGALRSAQLELADRHPHPYHWAPFVLVGSPLDTQAEVWL